MYFHLVVVLKRTWGKDARHIEFFSDLEDAYIPTVVLEVNNTERGEFLLYSLIVKWKIVKKYMLIVLGRC